MCSWLLLLSTVDDFYHFANKIDGVRVTKPGRIISKETPSAFGMDYLPLELVWHIQNALVFCW